jgi:hypothetical protein
MATTSDTRAPVHLWIVGILSLLWNAYGCYDYWMTQTHDADYLAQFPADALTYWQSLPPWLTAFWAVGVWGGLAGSVLLLMRSRYSVWAFALSAIGAVVGLGYQLFMTEMPASMKQGIMGIMPWVIIVVALFLAWYSWDQDKKGVLR